MQHGVLVAMVEIRPGVRGLELVGVLPRHFERHAGAGQEVLDAFVTRVDVGRTSASGGASGDSGAFAAAGMAAPAASRPATMAKVKILRISIVSQRISLNIP